MTRFCNNKKRETHFILKLAKWNLLPGCNGGHTRNGKLNSCCLEAHTCL
jgi:hypothetical protein